MTRQFASAEGLAPLPIDAVIGDIVASLRKTRRLVLEAPPGAGKTTRVPRAMFDAKMAGDGEIVVLEPRRLAARMAARRVAEEMGEEVGKTVGYQVRFEDVSSAETRIRFVTEGVLTRRLLSDPNLRGVSAVVLDEFHERHLHGDVALALVRTLQQTTRPDLYIVVMSATLATEPIATFLDAPIVRSEGMMHPVALEYLPAADDRALASQVYSALRTLLVDELDGDVLVFLPGASEIRKGLELCEKLADSHNLLLVPLHGDLSPQEQDRAVRRADRRKVIFSTNVAESSVTIDGIAAVIDSGVANVASHSPWSGVSTLRVEPVSRASATQRAGRAGRTRAGRCLRLYTKANFEARPDHDIAEIRRADVTQTVLELRAASLATVAWFEAPNDAAVRSAEALLERLGALSKGAITAIGKRMLRFAVAPRLARMIVEAEARGVADDGCTMAALVGEKDIRQSSRARFGEARSGEGRFGKATHGATERSDLVALLDLFRDAEERRFSSDAMRSLGLSATATMSVERARKQLVRACKRDAASPVGEANYERALLMSVLAGYPDRVAKRLRPGGSALAMSGGGSAELSESSAVRDAQWMVAVDAEEWRGKFSVRIASAIEPEWLIDLFADEIVESSEARWNAAAERVDATSRMLYDGLVIDESPLNSADSEKVKQVLFEAALQAGAGAFAADGAIERLLARAAFIASVDRTLTAPTEADVREALASLCEGERTFAALRSKSLVNELRFRMGAAMNARLDAWAPEKVDLPSGKSARVEYEIGKSPWVESHLQDFFGTATTPKVADGRVALVVHLWAPNRRAVQVTSDLAGFWERHYAAVRKELMRKYPRHFWPEDGRVAEARLRVKKR